MKPGDRVRVTKRKEGKSSNAISINNRIGTIYALDKFKITIEFSKDGQQPLEKAIV